MIKYLSLLCLILFATGLQAQDKDARKILDKLSDKYGSLEAVAIDFDLTIYYPEQEPVTLASHILQAGHRWLFKNTQQELYNDGEAIWMYIPDKNEVQIDDYDLDEAEDEGYFISPLNILQQYKGDTFQYGIYAKNKSIAEIEFKPTDEFSDYAKFRFTIDTKKNMITEVIAFGKNGSKALITIQAIDISPTITDDLFKFKTSEYPDIIIEDLRM